MSRMFKRVISLLIFHCIAIHSFGQKEWEQAFDDLYSMAQFTRETLVKVQTMPAKESLDFLDGALVEKARGIDPFGHAGFDPSGKIRLTL